MTTRLERRTRARWLPPTLALAAVALSAATAVLGWDRTDLDGVLHVNRVLELLAFMTVALLGALLVLRRPQHPVSWLLSAFGLSVLVNQAAQEYALHSVVGRTSAPGWAVAAWIGNWSTAVALVLLVELLLLFPTGRVLSRAWGWLARTVAVAGAGLVVGRAIAVWPQRGAALAVQGATLPAALRVLQLALIACVPVAVVALGLRYARSGHDQRQQLKLLLLAGCVVAVAVIAGLLALSLGITSALLEALGIIGIAGIAAAMTLAVLRYRLYDIDRIISRTVAYGVLTALLASVYAAGVVVTGIVLEPIAPDSSLAVATSTLFVAAAFTPSRVRVQDAVDRRFNRSRYDAERTVEAFRGQLRDDLRLEPLCDRLLVTVASTVQPARLSVWLVPEMPQAPARPVPVSDPRPA